MGITFGRLFACLVFAAACTFGGAARADEATDFIAKMTAAMAGIKSMQVSIGGSRAQAGFSIVMTIVTPDRVKEAMTMGPLNVDVYSPGDGFYYVHIGTTWQKAAFEKSQIASITAQATAISAGRELKLLPDRTEDGVVVGVYQSVVHAPAMFGAPAHVSTSICSYDKLTYLMKKCDDGTFATTYSHYDDPANVIELPPEAKDAALITLPAFPLSASPDPNPAPKS